MTIEDIINKYKENNAEEIKALEFAKLNKDIPFFADVAQVIDAKSLIKDGMIMIKKHPRFCVVKKHRHNYLEINYVLSGQIDEKVDNKQITLRQGELIFLGKNSSHEFLPAGENDIVLNFIILPEFFDFVIPFIDKSGLIKDFITNYFSNDADASSIIFRVSDSILIQNLISNILITYNSNTEGLNNILRYYFVLLIFELMNNTGKLEQHNSQNYDSLFLLKTMNYIEKNYSNASLQNLSNELEDNYNYVGKKIKKLTGKSFQNLLERHRLKVAESLLLSTKLNILDIAEHVGYSNMTFFYKIFKKFYGYTPLEYRKLKSINLQ